MLVPPMQRTVRLRAWQKAAIDKFDAHEHPDFLAVATPGAGKTTFALMAALRSLRAERGQRLIVVAPTAHLKTQWADAASRFGLQLDPFWSAGNGALPGDMHGIVTTYQQVATSDKALAKLSGGSFVILDEIHHAGDDRAWGDSVRTAFSPAKRRLALSGTPFRSDTLAIPFVRYTIEEAVADFEYGYGDALRDGGVVRPVYFPRINGFMEWTAPDGTFNAASFDDALDRTGASQRLRTALSAEGEWLPTVLSQAHQRLLLLREKVPNAGGLIIATDQEHARTIAEVMRTRLRVTPTIALSDDPNASDRIAHFAAGNQPWIIAVRMVSEGVDIPRLIIGVFATTTTTELFFRQAVGRLVRWTRGQRGQKAYLFVPDDIRLRTYAYQIADSRRHSLRKRAEDAEAEPFDQRSDTVPKDPLPSEMAEEQLSLFAALSSMVTDVSTIADVLDVFDAGYEDDVDAGLDENGDPLGHVGVGVGGGEGDGHDDLTIDLGAFAVPLSGGSFGSVGQAGLATYQQKEALRLRNADLARELVQLTGLTHREVNAKLNRSTSITKINDATLAQLQARLRAADDWLRQLTRR
jgi:superfamily II DNA or RNA helicase